jgi:hypothetical protein
MNKIARSSISWPICLSIAAVCTALIGIVIFAVTHIRIESGSYSIDQVMISTTLTEKQPVKHRDAFQPLDTIYCIVRTRGVDGPVGMRWFFEDEMISEGIGSTNGNIISSYIKDGSANGLPIGNYHVEIFIVEGHPLESVYFEIKPQSNP